MIHELDKNMWGRGIEPDYVPTYPPPDSTVGDTVADYLATSAMRGHISLPLTSGKYLALAAGQAYPEIRLAQRLKLNPNNIYLVDYSSLSEVIERFKNLTEKPKFFERMGMFSFLSNNSGPKFGLITALGIEYALKNEEAIKTFAPLTSHVMLPGAVLVVLPYDGNNPTSYFLDSGFEPVPPFTTYTNTTGTLIYKRI